MKIDGWKLTGSVWSKGVYELRPVLLARIGEPTYRLYIEGKRSVGYITLESGIRGVERRLK